MRPTSYTRPLSKSFAGALRRMSGKTAQTGKGNDAVCLGPLPTPPPQRFNLTLSFPLSHRVLLRRMPMCACA